MKSSHMFLAVLVGGVLAGTVHADNAEPSRHQLMKECMEKQKEAQSGKNRDEMRAFCADWAKTQRDAEKNAPSKG